MGQVHDINEEDKEIEEITYVEDETSDEDNTSEEEISDTKQPAQVKKTQEKKAQPKTPIKQEKKETAVKKPSYSEKDLRLLASLIFAEAGNQPYKGKLAVANIVINRTKSDVFWHANTIEEVIFDRKWAVQFSVTVKNKKTGISPLDRALKYYDTRKFTGSNPEAEQKAMDSCIKAAKAALEGNNNIGEYLCFTGNNRGANSIKKKYPNYQIIGNHIFYRTK